MLLNELSGLKDQMMENLDRVIEREQKVTISKMRANSLVQQSQQYGSRTRQVRNQMRRRRYCYIAIAIGSFIVRRIGVPNENFPSLGRHLDPAFLDLWHYFRQVLTTQGP